MRENDFVKEGHTFQLDISNIDELLSVINMEMERNVPMYVDEKVISNEMKMT